MTAETDRILGGRYRLTERIAGGGMGEVWQAQDDVLGRGVAVKILRREYADDSTFLERFRAEARHSAGLSHPNIAAVYDFGEGREEGGSPYLVMEHVPGEPLSALVSREGRLAPDRTLDIIGHAALGLQAAHDAGVIHRDVKPGNILVTPDGVVKITDFGIARATNSVPLTQTGAIMGTAYYISPEQASGQSVSPGSDIYSLGVVAYECLTGRRPFDGDTPVGVALAQVSQEPPALPDDLPAPVRELVMHMLAKDPAARPRSAGALGREALALQKTVAETVVTVPPLDRTRTMSAVEATAAAAGPETPDPLGDQTTVVVGRLSSDTDPGFRLPDVSQAPRWLPYAVALAVGAILLLLLMKACGGAANTAGTTPNSDDGASSAPSAATQVDVAADDYLGRPVAEAEADLVGLGLQVTVVRSEGGGVVGTVKDVTPTGRVEAGTPIELKVVSQPTERPADEDEEGDGDD